MSKRCKGKPERISMEYIPYGSRANIFTYRCPECGIEKEHSMPELAIKAIEDAHDDQHPDRSI